MRFEMNTSDFDEKFKKIFKKTVPELQEKGMGRAMIALLGDCVMEVPTVPVREGTLRGSGSIFVQNEFIKDSSDMPKAKAGKAVQNHNETIKPSSVVGVVGFNTPYAAKMHEGVDFKFTEPSSGAKYLESKMLRNAKGYMKEVAETILEGSK